MYNGICIISNSELHKKELLSKIYIKTLICFLFCFAHDFIFADFTSKITVGVFKLSLTFLEKVKSFERIAEWFIR